MRYLIIYTHPNPQSFNHAILEAITDELAKNDRELQVRDLYKNGFNPVLGPEDLSGMQKGSVSQDVRTEQEYIKAADVIIFIYPLWWSGFPAMLKGYIDRVFTEGFAYRMTESGIEGLLTEKKVLAVTTSGASRDDYEESGFFRSMSQVIDTGIFKFCGVDLLEHIFLFSVPYVTTAQRIGMLEDLRKTVREKLL
jgi:NAD(P)H dehydrogenase (quinone)